MQRFVPGLAGLLVSLCLAAPAVHAQSALRFTLPFGPFAVGFKTVDQYDYSRTFGEAYDQDGRPRTGERARPIQTSIWFPAVANGTRMRYREYLELSATPGSLPAHDADGKRAAARRMSRAFTPKDTLRLERELDAAVHAVRDAAPASGSFPVIVYGPSLNAPSFENAQLMEYLASYGYIVLSSPSMGAQGPQTPDGPGLESEARDMEFLIAYARSVPGADVNRLAVMGFSWGGIADVLVASRNPGVRALVSLDGSIAYYYHRLFTTMPFGDVAHFTVPALFLKQRPPAPQMIAGLGPDSTFDFFKDIRYSDAYVVNLVTLAHQNFGEWFDRLQQDAGAAFVADTIVQSAGYERIALYARNFFDGYLKQSADGKAFLARAPAENGFPASEVIIQRKTALRPLPTVAAFANLLIERSRRPSDAAALLAEVRTGNPAYMLDEIPVAAWGRRLMTANQMADAIGVLRLNTTLHPASAGAFANLGDAYVANGDRAQAIESYQRSLDLNASNVRVADALKKLRSP